MCILLIYMWIISLSIVELSTETLYFVYESVDKTIYTWIICGFSLFESVDNVKISTVLIISSVYITCLTLLM